MEWVGTVGWLGGSTTSSFTLLGMRMDTAGVIFAELACACFSGTVATTVEGGFVCLRGLAAPWRSSNLSSGGRIVQWCFSVRLNTLGESAVSNDPESPHPLGKRFLNPGEGLLALYEARRAS